jgi:uncharacterized protein (TIGR00369 family)
MELKGSQTEKNLEAAFKAESAARSAYLYYAHAAQQAGHSRVADVFTEIAQNEEEHARTQFEFLGRIQDTRTNLESAAQGEEVEYKSFYPEFARTARQEGFQEIADYFERMGRVEGRHKEVFLNLIHHLDHQIPIAERTAGHSSVTLVQLMLPQHANNAGFVHGGEVMKMMDSAAGVVAARHAHTNVVTASVEELNFLRPVRVGDLVFAHASLTFVGRSSMEVRVEVETENYLHEKRQMALTAYFIYVALDPAGKPTEIPSLLITTEEREKLFKAGQKRYKGRKK